MDIFSVITPVYDPVPEHLLAAYRSLCDQQVPAGWEWEWLVQEDGKTGVAEKILPSDARISHGIGRHLGVAMTRNLALARARGSIIKNLDQDDVLTEGALGRDLTVFAEHPDIEWTTSRALDLLPDGSTVGSESDPPGGPIPTGVVHKYWRTHEYRLPIHPTTLTIRRSLAEALGGWMAVPGSDDTGLLIAASVTALGYFHPEVGHLHRRWPGQVSAGPDHTESVERERRMRLIDARAVAIMSR